MGEKKQTSAWTDLYNATVKPAVDAWDESMKDPYSGPRTPEQQRNLDRRSPDKQKARDFQRGFSGESSR